MAAMKKKKQAISDDINRGKLKSVRNLKEKMAFAREAAANYFSHFKG